MISGPSDRIARVYVCKKRELIYEINIIAASM
jgi:hypothetical protein